MRTRILRALAIPAAALAVAACAAAPKAPALTPDERRLELESFDYVWSTVRDRHFDPSLGGLDWDAVRAELRPRVERAASRDEVRIVLSDLVGRFKQSHFQILPADLYEPAADGASGAVDGTTGVDARVVGGAALVTRVAPGSPAGSAGVMPGWEIVRIDDLDARRRVREMTRKYAARFDRDSLLAGSLRFALAGP
ncbi:MAG TPA: hypothetical protein VLN08_16955, partial [Vicinamibacterales bacterium]|nr:hypothetical protein [Vicinamibacterales bacterium]